SVTQMIIFRAWQFSGEPASPNLTFLFVTNNVTNGATVNPLSGGGYEFLLGTADFTVNAILDELDPALSLNWQIPTFTSGPFNVAKAIWTDGDGINNDGRSQEGDLSIGEPVEISAAPAPIPEPRAIIVLMVGVVTLLTFRPNRS